jgi:hypothetical protein
MSFVTLHRSSAPVEGRNLLAELSVVETLRALETDDSRSVPAGSRGTIVAVYGHGEAYEVEFASPVVGNCTVQASDLRAA